MQSFNYNSGVPMVECLQKFFRFRCSQCKKVYKKIVTNDISASLMNIEEALNSQ